MDPQTAQWFEQSRQTVQTGLPWAYAAATVIIVFGAVIWGVLAVSARESRAEEQAARDREPVASPPWPVVRTRLTPSGQEAAKMVAILAAISVGIILLVALKVWVP